MSLKNTDGAVGHGLRRTFTSLKQTDFVLRAPQAPLTTVKFARTPEFHSGEEFWTDVERMKGSVLSDVADMASML